MSKLKKNSPVSLTAIRKLLKEVVFNPRKPGPMAIISEVGSSEFYEHRAIEEIRAAQVLRSGIEDNEAKGLVSLQPKADVYHQHINKAIQLLLLARLNV